MKLYKVLARIYSNGTGSLLRDIILGGQDGLVNVLGIVLAVAFATSDARIVIIAGLAATFAESISMGAVAFTSTEAKRDYEKKMRVKSLRENPLHSAIVVGIAAFTGSLIPLVPFFFLPAASAATPAAIFSLMVLFLLGVVKARLTVGSWLASGLKIMLLGGAAAAAGFLIGTSLGVLV